MKFIRKKEDGQGLVEQALLLVLMAVVVIGILIWLRLLIIRVLDDVMCGLRGLDVCFAEAENYPLTPGWKLWQSSDFSGEWLITNEHPVDLGTPLNAELELPFKGTAVVIIYRKAYWYGTLEVEIDEKIVYDLYQGGENIEIINKVERYFDAGPMGDHKLVLRASTETGVITVDAIRFLGH